MSFFIDTTIPAANHFPGNDQPIMLQNFININGYVQVDHTNPDLNTGAGQHKQVTFQSNNVPGVFPVSPPVLFTNVVAGLPQLFFYSGDMPHSANQYVSATNGSAVLLGGLIVKWGSVNFAANALSLSILYNTTGSVQFPNASFAPFATSLTSTGIPANIVTISAFDKFGMTVNRTGGSGIVSNMTVYYFSVGN